jgi:hypothetical protein
MKVGLLRSCDVGQVLATRWSGTESTLDMARRQRLVSTVVIDVTNPLVFNQGPLPIGHTDSGGEPGLTGLAEHQLIS